MAKPSKGNTLKELFINIKLAGQKKASAGLKKIGRGFKALIGDLNVFKANLSALTVAGGIKAIGGFFRFATSKMKQLIGQSIQLASIQEDAELRLQTALQLSGQYSDANFKSLKRYAGELQQVSTVGDEVLIQQMAFGLQMGATTDNIKQMTFAALNLSEAVGIDVNTAMKMVARTLSGDVALFKRYGIDLSFISKEGAKAGEALDFINKRFGGVAQKNLKSFSAQFTQLQNIIGDAFEIIGKPINQALIPFIKQLKTDVLELTPTFQRLGNTFATIASIMTNMYKNLGGKDSFKGMVEGLGNVLTDMALLFEDFVYWITGERSFLGGKFGNLGDALDKGIVTLLARMIKAIGSAFGQAIGQANQDMWKSVLPDFLFKQEYATPTQVMSPEERRLWMQDSLSKQGMSEVKMDIVINTTESARAINDQLIGAKKQFGLFGGGR